MEHPCLSSGDGRLSQRFHLAETPLPGGGDKTVSFKMLD
jgi:hypothetical protein